jgi:hypothetical protein
MRQQAIIQGVLQVIQRPLAGRMTLQKYHPKQLQ